MGFFYQMVKSFGEARQESAQNKFFRGSLIVQTQAISKREFALERFNLLAC